MLFGSVDYLFQLVFLEFKRQLLSGSVLMEQLKTARQNAELGHYSIALTAYKSALDSKLLTANVGYFSNYSISFSLFTRLLNFISGKNDD